jgi:hypothetical protein
MFCPLGSGRLAFWADVPEFFLPADWLLGRPRPIKRAVRPRALARVRSEDVDHLSIMRYLFRGVRSFHDGREQII